MKPNLSLLSLLVSTILLGATASTPLLAQTRTANTGSKAARGSDQITLSFSNADISEVARTMAVITGRNVVVDPRVKGTLSLNTERPVSKAVAYNQFLSALRLQGVTVVETAGLYKLVPEAEAKIQGGEVFSSAPPSPGNQMVTQVFKLNHENAASLVPVLRPLISPNNTINASAGNALVITDYTDNLQRVARILAALDVPNASDLEIISLKHAIASDVVPLLVRLLETGSGAGAAAGGADPNARTVVLAEPRSNAVIVRAANPARVALARALVERLDQPGNSQGGASGNIHVVYLKNADATKLAATLRAALTGSAPAAATGAVASGNVTGAAVTASVATSSAGAVSTGGQIQADTATNSLIISAPEPQYRQLRAVIDLLDARRAQVFVESVIAEVSADKVAEFGVQWQGLIGNRGSGAVGILGTNFGSGGNNIINLATQGASGTVQPGNGLNLGLVNRTAGTYVLGFLARFLEQNGDGNILSTPNLLTLDNEEAKIVIGQNVPFVTGQYTNSNSGGNGAVNPFQTIERKDVGLTLRVRPQISENGTVKLQIFQEVSSVQASSLNSTTGLITNKRTIESNVLVDDGAIVVLGGLLQDEYSGNQDKIPGAGDVPFFGHLFKSEARQRKKTNLMVFLRPVVVRDAQAADVLSMDRYDMMRGAQRDAQPKQSTVVPINDAPMMPPQRAPQAPAQTKAPAASLAN